MKEYQSKPGPLQKITNYLDKDNTLLADGLRLLNSQDKVRTTIVEYLDKDDTVLAEGIKILTAEDKLKAADAYFRREDTALAKGLKKIFPKEGKAYRNDRGKELIERGIAEVGIAATAPLVGGFAAAVKLEDGGKAFYKQERIGRDGEPFDILKIRSLHEGADQDHGANIENAQTPGVSDDPRSTRVGKYMRPRKIDESPQLLNIAKGEMLLFGMRADNHTTHDLMQKERPDDFSDYHENYTDGKPAAINLMTAFSNHGTIDEQYHLNGLYARKASLGFDLYMGWRTLVHGKLKNK